MKYDYQKKYSEYSNSDLIKFHNNARITYYGCIGHFKSQQNEGRMSMIARELKNRGITEIPELKEGGKIGYNGDGAY